MSGDPWRLAIGARHDRPSQLALDAYWRFRIWRQRAGLVEPGASDIEDELLIGVAHGRIAKARWRADDAGPPLITVPVLEARPSPWDSDPAAMLVAVDLIALALEPARLRLKAWARLTGAADVLGAWRLDDSGVRLYRDPWRWLAALVAGRAGSSHACILDERGETASGLLLERLIGCEDVDHAALVEAQQKRVRARLINRLVGPAPPAPFVLKAAAA